MASSPNHLPVGLNIQPIGLKEECTAQANVHYNWPGKVISYFICVEVVEINLFDCTTLYLTGLNNSKYMNF